MIDINKENAILAGAGVVAGIGITALTNWGSKKLAQRKEKKVAAKPTQDK
jgi:hypothetical protein